MRRTKIARLLKQAAADLKANRLATPSAGNALSRYKEVLNVDPENDEAARGIVNIAARYIDLARSAITNREFGSARDYIARARSLHASSGALNQLSGQLSQAEATLAEENSARTLEQEQQREEQERFRIELERERESAAIEKRRRQELEAKRLFELEQNKQHQGEQQAVVEKQAMDRSTIVVEFDGFDAQLEVYGLNASEVRADTESRLLGLGYKVVPHHLASGSTVARLLVVRFRANLNSASGVFSYAASLSLYNQVPPAANSVGNSSQRPMWDKGTTGVAVQTQLRRVREEYKRTMTIFAKEIGNAPGRL